MDLVTRITEYLVARPASKAREIASALSADRTDVNRVLYAERGRLFELNGEFQWSAVNGNSVGLIPSMVTLPANNGPARDGVDAVARRRARAMLARLKRGVPPDGNVEDVAIGMQHLQQMLQMLLLGEGNVRWAGVTGEYGEGKSFFRLMAFDQGLDAGYAVASFDVNSDDGALHQPQRHMALFLNTMRSPLPRLQGHEGVVDLFRQWIAVTQKEDVLQILRQLDRIAPPVTNVHDSGDFKRMVWEAATMAYTDSLDFSQNAPLLRMANFLSCADLVWRSTQARFAAVYRLRLIVEWLTLTGHKGLLLFIDELDNVIRQIHPKAHPACFRSLAWYCTAPGHDALRIIVAMTPEMVKSVGQTCLDEYGAKLHKQQTVHPEERSAYRAWHREAITLSASGWPHCPTLSVADRMELFKRIAAFHELAWGKPQSSVDTIIRELAKFPPFRNTRRWVRASVMILDLMQQYPLSITDNPLL